MQVWASGGSSLTASTCSLSLVVQPQAVCKKSWPQQLQCWTLVHLSLCHKTFSTHPNDAPIRQRLAFLKSLHRVACVQLAPFGSALPEA